MEYESLDYAASRWHVPVSGMAPQAMKDAKRYSAVQSVHKAKTEALQKSKAKIHKVHKKHHRRRQKDSCLQKMDDAIKEDQPAEQQEEQEGGVSGG